MFHDSYRLLSPEVWGASPRECAQISGALVLCAISISQTPQPNMKSNEWDCIKFHRRILGDVLRFKAYRKSEIVKNNKKYGPI